MGVKEGREKATTITMVKVASRVEEAMSSKVVVMVSRVVVMVVATRVRWHVVLQQSSGDLSCVLSETLSYQPFRYYSCVWSKTHFFPL